MPLDRYRAKRHAGRTPEPSGSTAAPGGRSFVVQKHWATRMHFDLRLEHNGVLLSWAVPKGPSANPADKHVAIHVEDHPVDYADFEGIIPAGNYGAGAVIVWDRGTYVPLEDIDEGFEKGKLLFEMRGHKLRGAFTLVKIKKSESGNDWLLIKERDAHVSTEPYPETSVFSGLTVEQLKAGESPATSIVASLVQQKAPERRIKAGDISVMLAESREKPFTREGWVFEMKYDGYRIVAGRDGADVVLLSRNKKALTTTFPEIAKAISVLPYDHFVIDGEVVVCDANGRPNFQRLQQRGMLRRGVDVKTAAAQHPATLYVFDLLAFGNYDVRGLPLVERKRLLQQIIPAKGVLQYADHIPERGEDFFRAAESLGVEGMVGKKADAKYSAGRSANWVKVRVHRSDDFVVVGYSAPAASRSGFGSLHLAQYTGLVSSGSGSHSGSGSTLVYCGSVGTGFTQKMIDDAFKKLQKIEVEQQQFEGGPVGNDHTWVKPEMVCEVKFLEHTNEGYLRHPVFMRWRDDKKPEECQRAIETIDPDPETDPDPDEKGREASANEKTVPFSNLTKIYWPEDGYTKGDLIDYYREVSPYMLEFLKDRPVVMTRFPDGIHGKSFFQKDAPSWAPDWLRRENVWSEDGQKDLNYFVADDVESLLYVANMGTIPLHIWSSRVGSLEQPDWCIIDLDPKTAPFSDVVKLAQITKDLCDEIELPCFVKTTGSSGLHVLIPLGKQLTHEQSVQLGAVLAQQIVKRAPDIATIERNPAKRDGKVYVDFLQNGHGKLLVAPYAVRPLPGATVSAPLLWKEVNQKLSLKDYTIKTMSKRLAKLKTDPIAEVLRLRPNIIGALQRLAGMAMVLGAVMLAGCSSHSAHKLAMPKVIPHTQWETTPRLGVNADATRRNLAAGASLGFKEMHIDVMSTSVDSTSGKPVDMVKLKLRAGTTTEERTAREAEAFNWNGYHIAVVAIYGPGELGGGLVALEVATLASLPPRIANATTAGGADMRLRIPHNIQYVTLHNTGDSKPLMPGEDPRVRLRNLFSWGASDRNWWDLPYHMMLDLDGNYFEGRDYHFMGETNTTYNPSGHFLISVIGNYNRQEPTQAQLNAIADMMAWALQEFKLPVERIGGHYNYYDKTDCPGKNLKKYLEDGTFRRMVLERMR